MRGILLSWFLFALVHNINSLAGENPVGDVIATTDDEDEATRAVLYEGFVNGLSVNFDFVSLGKHNDAVEEGEEKPQTEEEREEEHKQNLEAARLEADYLTKHRPLESAPVPEVESDLYSMFNILIHYLALRSAPWKLVTPESLQLEDGGEKHMVFVSEGFYDEEQPIPRNMIFSVGHMKRSLPVKKGKTPIILTCLEAFIVCRLSYGLMSKLLHSTAPMDMKLKLLERWIQVAKEHFVLYLPYVTITAQRCFEVLHGDDENIPKDEYPGPAYKHLLHNCKALVHKRDTEGNLQTFVMLDSELHGKLIEKCLEEKHIIPSLLTDRDAQLKRMHKVIDKEVDWEVFSNAANMLLTKLERDILHDRNEWLLPATWGCNLDKTAAAEAERKLILAFVNSQMKLNLKVRSTIMALNKSLSESANDNGATLAASLKQFAQTEYEAAKEEAEDNKELAECMEAAKEKFLEDSKEHKHDVANGTIAKSLADYKHEGWMACMSSRILPTIKDVCQDNVEYCKSLLAELRRQQDAAHPHSTVALVLENLQASICAALLQNGDMEPSELKRYMTEFAKHELEEMKEIAPVDKKEEAVKQENLSGESNESEIKPHGG